MEYYNSILETIGNTPLIRLNSVTQNAKPLILAKIEYFNPGGSVKDRIALNMVLEAEKQGKLKPGGTIVEPTSGNTGVGLAMVANQRGYKCVFVVPDKVSKDKIDVLKAYGAEIEICPYAVEPDDPRSYYSVSDKLAKEIPNAWKPNQYANPSNPLSHYKTTGPEIWKQTDGKITHLVVGLGTTGTAMGTSRYLKEKKGENIKIIGADPRGSIYSSNNIMPYLVEGVGEDFFPTIYDSNLIDDYIIVSDADSFEMTRRLAKEESIFVGGSCGMAVSAAVQLSQTLTQDDVVVVILPDNGRGYLSKIFNTDWMSRYGFLKSDGKVTVGELLRSKHESLPQFIHAHPSETVREVIDVFKTFNVSQIPILKSEPPVTVDEIVGSVTETNLLDQMYSGAAQLTDPIAYHQSKPFPIIGENNTVQLAVKELRSQSALVVLSKGKPIGIVTRQDLLNFLVI